ncbi:hypothetical protein FACS1894190_09910 [Spirochaetia bacterium]|nr:hypothetical protein FACS1894190_09910 [Spirochaetia bacterium]
MKDYWINNMKLGIQSNFPNNELKTYGCFFFDILKIIEVENETGFTNQDIFLLLKDCKYKRYIGQSNPDIEDCYILNQLSVYRNCGGNKREYYKAPSKPPVKNYITEKMKIINGKEIRHFTAWIDGVEWDSLNPARPSNTGYKILNYRWFE